MRIKDLVVTGIVKLLRNATINTLVTEAINTVTKQEIDTLKGVSSNIQTQLNSIGSTVDTARTEQTTFKNGIANAINNIPRNPNAQILSSSSDLSQFVGELGEIEHGPDVSGVTADAGSVLQGKRFVDKDWNMVDGNIPIRSNWEKSNHDHRGLAWSEEGSAFGFSTGWYYYVGVPYGYFPPIGEDGYWELQTDAVRMNQTINLTAECIKHNHQIGYLFGTYDSDGNIQPNDMVAGTVGYSKGQRVVGTLGEYGWESHVGSDGVAADVGQTEAISVCCTESPFNRLYVRICRGVYRRAVRDSGDVFEVFIPNSMMRDELQRVYGFTAAQLAPGYNIFGVEGSFSSDANATASNIYMNKTAYVNGSKITGTMPNIPDYTRASAAGGITRSSYYNNDGTIVNTSSKKFIYLRVPRTGYTSRGRDLIYEASYFGTAAASDVVAGKTFTSASGFKVVGTGSAGLSFSSSRVMCYIEPDESQASWTDTKYDPIKCYTDPDHTISDIIAIAIYFTGSFKLFNTDVDQTPTSPTEGMTITTDSKVINDPANCIVIPFGKSGGTSDGLIYVNADWRSDCIQLYLESTYMNVGPGNGHGKVCVTSLYK